MSNRHDSKSTPPKPTSAPDKTHRTIEKLIKKPEGNVEKLVERGRQMGF